MGTFFGGPHNKDFSMLGAILGSPYLGKLPYSPYIIFYYPYLNLGHAPSQGTIRARAPSLLVPSHCRSYSSRPSFTWPKRDSLGATLHAMSRRWLGITRV